MGNASNFLKGLTLITESNYGWNAEYLDSTTGNCWLKYMVDRDNGRYYNLMFNSPRPTTNEIIDIAFSSDDYDEIQGASHRLLYDEEVESKEFRNALYEKLFTMDITTLSNDEKERIRAIILNTRLTDTSELAQKLITKL